MRTIGSRGCRIACKRRPFQKAAHRGKIRVVADPTESAREAGLRSISDDQPGIRRIRKGKGFRYTEPDGKPVRDPDTLRRIRSLVIPPA